MTKKVTGKKEYKYILKHYGVKDTPSFRAGIEYLNVYPLWKDSGAQVVTHEEYTKLTDSEEISSSKSYWGVPENKVGVICKTSYSHYNTWEGIFTALGDFEAGWKACEKAK